MIGQLCKFYTGSPGSYKSYYPGPKLQATPEQSSNPQKTQRWLVQSDTGDDLCVKLFLKLSKYYNNVYPSKIDNIKYDTQYHNEKEIEIVSFRVFDDAARSKIMSALTRSEIPFKNINFWIYIEANDIRKYLSHGSNIIIVRKTKGQNFIYPFYFHPVYR